ncbi:CPBP family intramembrane glutamic endopeptidase [Amycolatopsis suaedae]|uniref:CPBP family intramembrane metalloprotease n=1 Tax=Amycolatopsis suaedae TaxID=2510978 RepID=A0A4V2EM04_9PSEU|nr:type II CAAX endopeptidase family protein [Amycolatopsis suaedae]RZQ63375.1 CPBP family intramembrane metalloprotease [Amycolatopsis suaedae]
MTSTPSTGWRALVLRYPLISFFTLANAISWLAWTPYILSLDGLGILAFRYPDFLITNQLTAILPGAYLGPLAAAFTVTAVTEGRAGLRRWRRRLFQVRAGLRWYALALFGIPLAIVAGTFAMDGAEDVVRLPSMTALALYLPMLLLQFFTTGLAEEPGWRDFALTRLQQRHHPLVATTILGVLWTIWHLPLFLTPWGGPDAGPEAILRFFVLTMAISYVITLVFNRAHQSVPLIMLLHSNINNFMSVMWPDVFPGEHPEWLWGPTLGFCTLALVVIASTRGRLGLPRTPVEVAA